MNEQDMSRVMALKYMPNLTGQVHFHSSDAARVAGCSNRSTAPAIPRLDLLFTLGALEQREFAEAHCT